MALKGNKMKILVLILSTQAEDYEGFIKSIRKGWKIQLEKKGISVYFYEGGHQHNYIEDDTLMLNVDDDLFHTARKFKEAVKLINKLNIEYDILYRTNLSSFIEANNFVEFANKLGMEKFIYNGVVGKTNKLIEYFITKNRFLSFLLRKTNFFQKIKFASGSGLFLDKYSAQKISNSNKYDQYIDDIMIALVLKTHPNQNKVSPMRFDCHEDMSHKLSSKEYMKLVQVDCLFHYRFKTTNRNNDALNIENFCSVDYRLEYCTTDESNI